MRIKVDRTVCDGFGKCAEHAPSVFSLDEWGYASLAGAADVPADLESPVRRAILDCPVDAIIERATKQSD
jgi:ferredoxin